MAHKKQKESNKTCHWMTKLGLYITQKRSNINSLLFYIAIVCINKNLM